MSLAMRQRPSPAIVIAVVALAFAVVGSAIASTSGLDKITKSKVRSIADKEIAKKAPGLSVAHAAAADTVGGKSAAALAPSSGFDQNSAVVSLGLGFTTVASATITTSAPGQVLATGSAELDGNVSGDGNRGQCMIAIDGTSSAFYELDLDDVGALNQGTVAVTFARTLPAGSHTAELRCTELSGDISKDDAAIQVIGINTP
ncbi:MAG: hypothetical protein ACHQJ5_05375 [Vicinamibacteria bacterium]|jgi:hypothetical protein